MARAPQKGPQQRRLPISQAMTELGAAGESSRYGLDRDEFLPELRGSRGMKKYREMGDNDPVIGALLYAIQMMLRAVPFRPEAADDSDEAKELAEFTEDVFDHMDHSWDDFLSRALSFIQYGFSYFECVYKRRPDGFVGVRKIASRPQSTLHSWAYDEANELIGMVQSVPGSSKTVTIPLAKSLHFRTTTQTDSPSGRSALRSAYRAYYMATNIENIEAIAIERELNGLPLVRMPAEYMVAESGPMKTFRDEMTRIARDVKQGEQSYLAIPSDFYQNEDGSLSGNRMVEFELIASQGSRAIDTDVPIKRYRQDMARTVLADFIMLGQSDKGSFALSKSKADLFLRALEGHAEMIAGVLNRQFMPRLWALNGFNPDLMPTIVPGAVAPADLTELGDYIKALASSGYTILDEETETVLREAADLPTDGMGSDPDMMGMAPPSGAETGPESGSDPDPDQEA